MSKIKRLFWFKDKDENMQKPYEFKKNEVRKPYRERVSEERVAMQQRALARNGEVVPQDVDWQQDIDWSGDANWQQSITLPQGIISPKGVTSPQGVSSPQGIVLPQGAALPQGATSPRSITSPQGIVSPKGVSPQGATSPKGLKAPIGTKRDDDFYRGSFSKIEPVKPKYEDVKLTIILLENTVAVEKEKAVLKKIVANLVTPKKKDTTGFLCVINYGSLVRIMEKIEIQSFNCDDLFNQEDIGDNACLYDALLALESVVNHNYNVLEWLKFKRVRISNIEIIGIGRGIDNFSAASSEKGIENFEKVLKRNNVVTRYFCLSEENFIDVATIGFHSIGAIQRKNTQ